MTACSVFSAPRRMSHQSIPLQVKRRTGLEDIRTTFDTYGHLFPDREEDLVAALDARKRRARGEHADSASRRGRRGRRTR